MLLCKAAQDDLGLSTNGGDGCFEFVGSHREKLILEFVGFFKLLIGDGQFISVFLCYLFCEERAIASRFALRGDDGDDDDMPMGAR